MGKFGFNRGAGHGGTPGGNPYPAVRGSEYTASDYVKGYSGKANMSKAALNGRFIMLDSTTGDASTGESPCAVVFKAPDDGTVTIEIGMQISNHGDPNARAIGSLAVREGVNIGQGTVVRAHNGDDYNYATNLTLFNNSTGTFRYTVSGLTPGAMYHGIVYWCSIPCTFPRVPGCVDIVNRWIAVIE